MRTNLLDSLKTLLQKDERLTSEGELLKNKIIELALKLDKNLIKLLLSDEKMKEVFFTDVEATLIFDKDKFIRFVSNKQFLPDSYTSFKNKIGLVVGDEFISGKKEVVLSWPYKDCVLEGGMTKEDQKRDEIFWNETLAPDEISRLLDTKVFTNAKRIDKNGEHKLDKFRTDENGNIKDNLIIKGNNLLALHSIKKRFAGKVKLIYIDPPFNRKKVSFYNDNFKHSSWLTFMKNRLEVAKKFLSDDGIICVHLDDSEGNYNKVLMDEIFGRENYLNTVSLTTNEPSGFKTTAASLFSTANYIFIYTKGVKKATIKKVYIESEYDSMYNKFLLNKSKSYKNWRWENIGDIVAKKNEYYSKREAVKGLGSEFESLITDFAIDNADKVFRTAAIRGGARKKRIQTIKKSEENKGRVYKHPNDNIENFYILNGEQIIFFEDRLVEIDGMKLPGKLITDVWTDISWTGIANEGGVTLKDGKKPEKLIKRVLDIFTEEGDLILDFFMGSGTTCAVAHKMGCQYIGIEQLDYEDNSAVVRLKNVINGDQSGISKSIDWKGGGDFVYLELMKWNENFVEKIRKAKTKEGLAELWETMKKKAFLSYKVDIKAIDENAKDFADLSIEDKKRFLLECLDKNHLYVNYSEIDDEEYGVSESDKRLNKEFYNK